MSHQIFCYGLHVAETSVYSAHYFPSHFWRILRHAAVYLAVELFHDLCAAAAPPCFCVGYFLAVLQHQWIGQRSVLRGLAFIAVGGIGSIRIAGRPAANG